MKFMTIFIFNVEWDPFNVIYSEAEKIKWNQQSISIWVKMTVAQFKFIIYF